MTFEMDPALLIPDVASPLWVKTREALLV